MKYESKTYSPDELRVKWENTDTNFPRSKFVFAVVWQFFMGVYPLVVIDYWIWQLYKSLSLTVFVRIALAPLIFVMNYAGYIYFTTWFCALLVEYYNRKSPPRQGIFLRSFDESGMENPELDYYHLRGVVYKWPVFFAKKSIFPWTVLWVLRRMGRNKVHKNAMFGDMYPGLESAHAEDGTIIMDGSSVSSHVVDAIFGSLSIFEVDLSKNSTIHANTIVGPGSDVEADLSIGPRVLLPKKWENKVENSHFVWGNPVPASKRNSRGNLMDLIPKSFKKSHPIYDPQKKII